MTINRERLTKRIDHRIETANATLASWNAKFLVNPYSAFDWSTDAFDAAATLSVLTGLRQHINIEGLSDEDVKQMVLDRVLRDAGSHQRSTSPSANIIAASTTKAWVDAYELLLSNCE